MFSTRAAVAAITALTVAAAAWILGVETINAQTTCEHVAVRSPFSGDRLSGTVPVYGSASIDGLAFYKVEWAPASEPETWRAVSTVRPEPVFNNLLDVWDTTVLPDGLYLLKLTVVDQAAQEPCRVTLRDLHVVNGASATPAATATAPVVVVRPGAAAATPEPPSGEAGSAPMASAPATAPSVGTEETAKAEPGEGTGAEGEEGTAAENEEVEPPPATEPSQSIGAGEAGGEPEAADSGEAAGSAQSQAGDETETAGNEGRLVLSTSGKEGQTSDVEAAAQTGAEASTQEQGGTTSDQQPASEQVSAGREAAEAAAGLIPDATTLADAIGATTWPRAFCGGALAMLLLMAFGYAIVVFRRRR